VWKYLEARIPFQAGRCGHHGFVQLRCRWMVTARFSQQAGVRVVGALQVVVFILVFNGQRVLPALGLDAAMELLGRLQQNKFAAVMGIWFVGNTLSNALVSTGAFEVFCDGNLVRPYPKLFALVDRRQHLHPANATARFTSLCLDRPASCLDGVLASLCVTDVAKMRVVSGIQTSATLCVLTISNAPLHDSCGMDF
jgi:hypothetical protein